MSIKTGKKLGLFMSLTMLLGSVVGIGIFFKSHSILTSTGWNGTGTLVAWILGGLLSLAAAISFSEISSFKTFNVHGLAGWTEKVGGKKLGYFVRFSYSFFYFGLLASVLGVFGSEMFFNLIAAFKDGFNIGDVPMYAHIILGLFIVVSFTTLNFLSARAGGWVQSVSTVLKWVPLLLVAFAGLILATTNHSVNGTFGVSAFSNGTEFKFTAMLSALPAVLFAFDAFLSVGALRNKMKDPQKLPMVVFVGMLTVLVLYLMIATAAVLHGSGMVSGAPFGAGASAGYGIFDQIFTHSVAEAMGKFVIVFLLISTLGVINGISAAGISVHEQAVLTDTIFGLKGLRNKFGDNKVVVGYAVALLAFWTIVFGIPAIILNSDSIIDGFSNFPTLFFFALYALVIVLYAKNRDKFDTKKINKYVFYTFSTIAVVGIFFVVAYQVSYGFLIGALQNKSDTTHWGLFAGDTVPKVEVAGKAVKVFTDYPTAANLEMGIYMSRMQSVYVFFSMLVVFLSAPFINKFLIKKFEKRDVVVDTQVEVK